MKEEKKRKKNQTRSRQTTRCVGATAMELDDELTDRRRMHPASVTYTSDPTRSWPVPVEGGYMRRLIAFVDCNR